MPDETVTIAPLFSGDPELEANPTNSAELAARIAGVRKIEAKIEEEKVKKQEAIAYYDRRVESAEQQIKFLKGQIEYYLALKGLKSCPTHLGTETMVERHPRKWPEDAQIVGWVSSLNDIEPTIKAELLKTEVKPVKDKILDFLEQTGKILPGLTTVTETKLQIRN